MKTLYSNMNGDEIDLTDMLRDLKAEGLTKKQIEKHMIRYILDEGIQVYLYDLSNIID